MYSESLEKVKKNAEAKEVFAFPNKDERFLLTFDFVFSINSEVYITTRRLPKMKETIPNTTERCDICKEQYPDAYDIWGDPIHKDCEEQEGN